MFECFCPEEYQHLRHVTNQNLLIIVLIFFLWGHLFPPPRFAGYKAGACFQPEAVNVTLRTLVSPVPVVLIIVGLLVLKTYPIDVKMKQENQNMQQQTQ